MKGWSAAMRSTPFACAGVTRRCMFPPSRAFVRPSDRSRLPMLRVHLPRLAACVAVLIALAPARRLAAQNADSVPTIEASQLGTRLSVINQDEIGRVMMRHAIHGASAAAGTASVSFVIDEAGHTRDVHVVTSSGSKAVDRAAEQVVKEMRYTPPVQDGQPVRVHVILPLSFALQPG